ncbi:hypothetical protein HPB52_008262 [Rhipicephalus sanguineus]|uniref:Uncharacterized protein n=2 Tax=Rhipicephalus sanguineus TaxID=34632 RepID=A0A9D4Q5R1_RHISA|nr:hypothetical protein HPB52_008262 [Rhipicephalus sanguineus]
MAVLFPVNIDEEELSSLQPEDRCDPFEERLQQTIDQFFSSQEIVPSPLEPPWRVRSPTPAFVGENSGIQPGRELHAATVWSQTTFSISHEVDLCTILEDHYTFHAAQNEQAAREGITGCRFVTCRLFCSVIEEEPTNESRSCQPLRLLTGNSREGLSQ